MPGTGNSGGRNKKPTQLHMLRGTYRSDRHGDHQTPDPSVGTPTRPRKLSGVARAEWTRMIARLADVRTLRTIDDAWLYQYVQLYAETEAIAADQAARRQLQALLKTYLPKLKGSALVEAISEIVKLEQLLDKQTVRLRQGHLAIKQYLVESGMTPAARSRVKLPNTGVPVAESKLDQFIRRVK
jgi:phage terminase small subunit